MNERNDQNLMLAVLCLLIVALILLVGFHRIETRLTAVAAEQNEAVVKGPDFNQAALISQRVNQLLQLPDTDLSWPAQLASGRISMADYLLRVFIAPAYLRGEPDDDTFIQDIFRLINGTVPTIGQQTEAELVLHNSGSRLGLINWVLAEYGYPESIKLPAEPTRLRTIYVADDRPDSGSEIVGRLRVNSELRLTGQQARMKLYANGQIRADLALTADDPTLLNHYTIEWDTARESVGDYELALLVLTNDGRGFWQSMESYQVPVVIPLASGQLRHDHIVADPLAQQHNWYLLTKDQGRALLNIVSSEKSLRLELYDTYMQWLAETKSHAEVPAALRYRADTAADSLPDSDSDSASGFYVKAVPDLADPGTGRFNYVLLPALAVAVPQEQPERYLGVMAVRDGELLIEDEAGGQSWQPLDQYHFFDPEALLGQLELSDSEGAAFDFVPAFDRNSHEYALVVRQQTATASLDLQPMEGSAADIAIVQQSTAAQVDIVDGLINLAESVNDISIQVTGFDGVKKTYVISILRPPHHEGFDQTLNQFPYTYQSWLWYTHLQHPAYQFTADQTEIAWPEFIDAQSHRDRSLVDANTNPESWVRPASPVYDGVSWKAASRPVIGHFADPRNFLDPVNIFQFESMVYNPSIHTREGIEAILRDTFMEQGNPENIDYAELLLMAGERAQISPFFLASKIIQEMGRLGQSPLAFGELDGYQGAYNFYNINATPNPDLPDGARINGARFALFGIDPEQGEISEQEAAWLIPWNNPERAIIGGALWISERYVNAGQDTLYLQKFDLVGADGLYMRQYAQNIQMAWAEGRRTYRAYAEMDLLDQPFAFKIPVFEQMSERPGSLP